VRHRHQRQAGLSGRGWQTAARGLAAGEHHRQRIYRHFVPQGNKIIPTIRGEAWVCGDNRLILNPDDPFCWGIAL
jgi:proline racemase